MNLELLILLPVPPKWLEWQTCASRSSKSVLPFGKCCSRRSDIYVMVTRCSAKKLKMPHDRQELLRTWEFFLAKPANQTRWCMSMEEDTDSGVIKDFALHHPSNSQSRLIASIPNSDPLQCKNQLGCGAVVCVFLNRKQVFNRPFLFGNYFLLPF